MLCSYVVYVCSSSQHEKKNSFSAPSFSIRVSTTSELLKIGLKPLHFGMVGDFMRAYILCILKGMQLLPFPGLWPFGRLLRLDWHGRVELAVTSHLARELATGWWEIKTSLNANCTRRQHWSTRWAPRIKRDADGGKVWYIFCFFFQGCYRASGF